jgi:hypothetical protein
MVNIFDLGNNPTIYFHYLKITKHNKHPVRTGTSDIRMNLGRKVILYLANHPDFKPEYLGESSDFKVMTLNHIA